MKLIALSRNPGHTVAAFPDSILVPDSAITLPGRPLFVPDFTPSWSAQLLIGVRINRLGKSITPKFAPRYYDSATLLMRLIPEPSGVFPGALVNAFDGCIQLGNWSESADILRSPSITVSSGDLELTLTPEQMAIDEAVATVSNYVSIRTGDIICPVTLPWRLAVKQGDTVVASLGEDSGNPCLRARLK